MEAQLLRRVSSKQPQSLPNAGGEGGDGSGGGDGNSYAALADSEQPEEGDDNDGDSSESSSEGDQGDDEEDAVPARRGSAHPADTRPAASTAAVTMSTRPLLHRGRVLESYIVGTLHEADERAHVMETLKLMVHPDFV